MAPWILPCIKYVCNSYNVKIYAIFLSTKTVYILSRNTIVSKNAWYLIFQKVLRPIAPHEVFIKKVFIFKIDLSTNFQKVPYRYTIIRTIVCYFLWIHFKCFLFILNVFNIFIRRFVGCHAKFIEIYLKAGHICKSVNFYFS